VRILDFSERGQGRKTELVEACDFMGIKPKNSRWNHGLLGRTALRPKACLIPAQGNALGSSSNRYSVAGQGPAS